MGILDPIYANPLSVRIIPNVDPNFAEQLKLRSDQHSIGLITADNDDATYVSIDEATKMADVEVVYAHSFYAGAAHASGLLSGEIMAILIWYSANENGSIAFFPHLISRTGSYLSKVCNIPLGAPIAYLIAPPMEGLVALDAALKASATSIASLTMPPSETNYMGVMLTGDQPACKAATIAFREMVLDIARDPIKY